MRVMLVAVRVLIVAILLLDLRLVVSFARYGRGFNAAAASSPEGPLVSFVPVPWTTTDSLYLGLLICIHVALFWVEWRTRIKIRAGLAR
jgi:hypothetical protein